jgi:hypothetical protein
MYESFKVGRYNITEELEEVIDEYCNNEIDSEGRTQHDLDYDSKVPELLEINDKINKIRNFRSSTSFDNIEEYCNENISPNTMIKILSFFKVK